MTNPVQFVKEAWSELRKVVWPTRKEVVRITFAVIVLSLLVAAFLGGIDFGLTELFKFLANR
jgi:preprotein translocase subunit SecE